MSSDIFMELGLVVVYDIMFSPSHSRNGRMAVPAQVSRGNAALRNAKENSLQVKGMYSTSFL